MNSDKSLVISEPQCHLSKIIFQRDAWRIKHCITRPTFITCCLSYDLHYSSENQSKAGVLFLFAVTAQLSKNAVSTKDMLLLRDPSWVSRKQAHNCSGVECNQRDSQQTLGLGKITLARFGSFHRALLLQLLTTNKAVYNL